MPPIAELVKVVDPDSGAGTDYASGLLWEAAYGGVSNSGDLVGQNQIAVAKCRSTGGTADTSNLYFDGWTSSSSSCYIKYWTDPSDTGGDGPAGCYRHNGVYPSGGQKVYSLVKGATCITVNVPYTRVEGITVYGNSWSGNNRRAIYVMANSCQVAYNLVRCSSAVAYAYTAGIYLAVGTGNQLIYGNVVYNMTSTGSYASGIYVASAVGQNAYVFYNTVVDCTYGITRSLTNGNAYLVGNISFGCTDAYYGSWSSGSVNNAYDEGIDPGADGILLTGAGSDYFDNYSGGDFHVKSGTDLINAGENVFWHDVCPVRQDVDLTYRTPTGYFDVGADEYAGASTTAPPATGPVYYVDQVNGNDSNTGTTMSAPWKTLAKVSVGPTSAGYVPGTTIYLKRGCTWREKLTVPSSGTSTQRITFSAYGSGDDPIINGSDIHTSWSNYSGSIWRTSYTYSTDPRRVHINGVPGQRQTSISACNGFGKWICTGGYVYLWSPGNPASTYTSPGVEIPHRQSCVFANYKDYITVQNLHLTKAHQENLLFRNCNAPWIRYIETDFSGRHGCQVTAGMRYTDSTDQRPRPPSEGAYVRDGIIEYVTSHDHPFCAIQLVDWGSFMSYHTVRYNHCYNTAILKNGDGSVEASAFLVSPSGGLATILSLFGYTDEEKNAPSTNMQHCYVYGNHVHHNGAKAAKGHGCGIWLDQCSLDIHVYQNLIHDNTGAGIDFEHTFDSWAYYNVCYNNGMYQGTAGDETAGICIRRGAKRNKIYNNVCYDNSTGIICFGANSDEQATYCQLEYNDFRNNICFNNTSPQAAYYGYELYAYRGGDNVDSTRGNDNTYTYNCFGAESASFVKLSSGTKSTYAAVEAVLGTMNSVEDDPDFYDETRHNFHLQGVSPCINAGTDVGLTEDYDGATVPAGPAPDVGAFEYDATYSTTSTTSTTSSTSSTSSTITVSGTTVSTSSTTSTTSSTVSTTSTTSTTTTAPPAVPKESGYYPFTSGTDMLFDRMWIVPREIEGSYITEDSVHSVIVWNAYLDYSWSVVSLDVDAPDGTSISPAWTPPGPTVPIFGEYEYTVTVLATGPTQQNTTYTLGFNDYWGSQQTLTITGVRYITIMLEPDWRSPLEVRQEYDTSLYAAETFYEQRRPLRNMPAFGLRATYHATNGDAEKLAATLLLSKDKAFILPIYTEGMIPSVLTPGSTTATLTDDTTYLWYTNNRAVWFEIVDWTSKQVEVKRISSIATNALTFVEEIYDTFAVNSAMVYPAMLAKLRSVRTRHLTSRIDVVEAEFEEMLGVS